MNVPVDLKYTKDHEWLKIEDGGVCVIGITDFAQSELGDIVYVEIETEGEALEKEDTFGTIEAVKTVSDMFMPVGGTVLEVNPLLDGQPEIVNQDPYGQGWMIKVQMDDPSQVEDMLSAADYEQIIH